MCKKCDYVDVEMALVHRLTELESFLRVIRQKGCATPAVKRRALALVGEEDAPEEVAGG